MSNLVSSREKHLPLEILKNIVTTSRNWYKKVSFIQVDEYGELVIYSEFIRTFHNMNIIVQTTDRNVSSLNGKIETPNKTLANTTRALLLESSHKKELWCLAYQYIIWISKRTQNRFRGDVTYFLWYG